MSMTNLSQILIGELGITTGMFYAGFKNAKFSRFTFLWKVHNFQLKLGFQASLI